MVMRLTNVFVQIAVPLISDRSKRSFLIVILVSFLENSKFSLKKLKTATIEFQNEMSKKNAEEKWHWACMIFIILPSTTIEKKPLLLLLLSCSTMKLSFVTLLCLPLSCRSVFNKNSQNVLLDEVSR